MSYPSTIKTNAKLSIGGNNGSLQKPVSQSCAKQTSLEFCCWSQALTTTFEVLKFILSQKLSMFSLSWPLGCRAAGLIFEVLRSMKVSGRNLACNLLALFASALLTRNSLRALGLRADMRGRLGTFCSCLKVIPIVLLYDTIQYSYPN